MKLSKIWIDLDHDGAPLRTSHELPDITTKTHWQEFININSLKQLILERIEAKKKWDFSKDDVIRKMMCETAQQALIEELESLLTELELNETR